MDNDQNNNDPREQARNLYFQSGLTQAQIAILIGVSQKTISLWINDGKWKMLKDTASQMPALMVEHMFSELTELNKNIAAREPGQRFPTVQEAETRRKIMVSLQYTQDYQSKGAQIETMMNFIHYVRRTSKKDVVNITLLADKYLEGEVKIGQDPFKPYTLPGTPPDDPEPGPSNDDAPTTPPPGSNPPPVGKSAASTLQYA